MWTIIIGILLFALVTAFLYGWGLVKSRDEQRTLTAMLVSKCEKKIRKHLRQHGSITLKEAQQLLEGTTVTLFYTKKKFGVTDGRVFGEQLLTQMEHRGILTKGENGYILTKKGK